jgi:enhancing lycopene biosynthesis protein 2
MKNEYLIKITDEIEKECKAIEQGKRPNTIFLKNAIETIKMFDPEIKNENAECNITTKELYEENNNFVACVEQAIKENNQQKIVETAWRYAQYVKEKVAK